jgi:hypothetical protein
MNAAASPTPAPAKPSAAPAKPAAAPAKPGGKAPTKTAGAQGGCGQGTCG